MTMMVFFLILAVAGLTASTLYYWSRMEYYKAQWQHCYDPLDPPMVNIRSTPPEFEYFDEDDFDIVEGVRK